MKFWDVEVDLEQGEEVIIDRAEQPGIVKSIDNESYLVEYKQGSVYTTDLGYNGHDILLPREGLRKIK